MAKHPATSLSPARIPRFVQRLAAYAEARGINVDFRVARFSLADDDPGERLWMNWRTTRQHFLSFDLLTPGYRVPATQGFLSVPLGPRFRPETALLAGYVTVTGGELLWEIDTGPAEFTIEERGDVEVVTYADRVVYHGTLDALIAVGIDRKRMPTGKKPAKTEHSSKSPRDDLAERITSEKWCSRRQLDNSIVYRVETERARNARVARELKERRAWGFEHAKYRDSCAACDGHGTGSPRPTAAARPSYLRLVVDNTRTRSTEV